MHCTFVLLCSLAQKIKSIFFLENVFGNWNYQNTCATVHTTIKKQFYTCIQEQYTVYIPLRTVRGTNKILQPPASTPV